MGAAGHFVEMPIPLSRIHLLAKSLVPRAGGILIDQSMFRIRFCFSSSPPTGLSVAATPPPRHDRVTFWWRAAPQTIDGHTVLTRRTVVLHRRFSPHGRPGRAYYSFHRRDRTLLPTCEHIQLGLRPIGFHRHDCGHLDDSREPRHRGFHGPQRRGHDGAGIYWHVLRIPVLSWSCR